MSKNDPQYGTPPTYSFDETYSTSQLATPVSVLQSTPVEDGKPKQPFYRRPATIALAVMTLFVIGTGSMAMSLIFTDQPVNEGPSFSDTNGSRGGAPISPEDAYEMPLPTKNDYERPENQPTNQHPVNPVPPRDPQPPVLPKDYQPTPPSFPPLEYTPPVPSPGNVIDDPVPPGTKSGDVTPDLNQDSPIVAPGATKN